MRAPKRAWTDLAVFGGEPAFPEKLYVGRPNIGNRDRLFRRIDEALGRRWLSNDGACALELEQRIADLLGVRYCTAICNGTVALEVAIRALGISGEVIVPSFTFIATAHALQWLGITPLFCDVDRRTHNLDPSRVEEVITPHTSGIIGVHLWGKPCEVETLSALAERRGLALMFDAAHAFACSHRGRMVGNFGRLEVFSFHATKFFNTFEGGAIVTNDDGLAARVRAMRNFGYDCSDRVSDTGTNGKMNEISAAMGLTGLDSLQEFVAANYANYKRYQAELPCVPGLDFHLYDEEERNNYQYIILTVDETVAQISRDQILKILQAENVMAQRYFHPGCHRAEPYRSRFPGAGLRLPVTELLSRRVLALPTGTALGQDDVGAICEIIRLVVSHAHQIGERLAA